MSVAYWLNTAWMWKCAAAARGFDRMTRDVACVQAQVLTAILHRNRSTWFGAKHGFERLSTPRAYQEHVPLTTYEDYAAPIDRIAAGEQNVLTHERVLLLEPTSGTTGGEKLIPYTASLRQQFQRALAVWIADLYRHRPAIRNGRAYWSISPALGPRRRSPAGIPIGFDSDSAYLGGLERLALDHLLVAPSAVAGIPNIEAFRYVTLLSLLRSEDLALISVWNPTFLTVLVSSLPAWSDRLCRDLGRGTIEPPAPCFLPSMLRNRTKSLPRRAEQLAALARCGGGLSEVLAQLWPRLAVISCWADAAAAGFLPDLRALFPGVEIQPKGLLATEGCVSFPLVGRSAPVLAVGSHFFEFLEADGSRCRLAHELAPSGRYRVVLTTGGGLYRYQLHDEVEVVGFENLCPLLRFLGKADRVSDLVGEKLAEPHVRQVLDRLFAAYRLTPHFALLVPVLNRPPRYRLYLQGWEGEASAEPVFARFAARQEPRPPLCRAEFAQELQDGLETNPHYRYAVRLGQLDPVEVIVLDGCGEPAERIVERRWLELGQKAGAIKPAVLDAWTGWPARFRQAACHDQTPDALPPIRASNR